MERKFNIPAVAVSAIAVLLSFFCFSVEAVAAGTLGIFLILRKKDTHTPDKAPPFTVGFGYGRQYYLHYHKYHPLRKIQQHKQLLALQSAFRFSRISSPKNQTSRIMQVIFTSIQIYFL